MIELRQGQGNGPRDALRDATRQVHERLHVHPRLKPLADGSVDRSGYADALARLYGFHAAAEAAFAGAAHLTSLDMTARCKAALLRSDLAALGFECAQIDALPLCRDLPLVETEAVLLGCAYVVEGSTLGGRALARAVAPLLGDGLAGRRFLLGYGDGHGAMWREFVNALEMVTSTRYGELTEAALATFAAFECWMD